MWDKVKESGLLKSKKFWMSLLGLVSVVLNHLFGMDEQGLLAIGGIVMAYLLGQGLADLGKEKAKVEDEVYNK